MRRWILPGLASLLVESDAGCEALVAGWVPRTAREDDRAAGGARITVTGLRDDDPTPVADHVAEPPRFTAWGLEARVQEDVGRVTGPGTRTHATIDLARGRALCALDLAQPEVVVYAPAMLLVSAALLLARAGHALVHAGAVVSPAGEGWLVVGDSHAGKSTTCRTFAANGWRYLADDQVVLSRAADGIRVDGWPRIFHLDTGWGSGAPTGVRREVPDDELAPRRHDDGAMLRGALVPRVDAEGSTSLEPAPAAEVLVALIRQSPWLLADRAAASALLALLRDAASTRGRRLLLARDTFGRPEAFARAVVDPLMAGA